MKNKKASVMVAVIIVVAILVVGAGIFLYPYEPKNPVLANSTGSTPQGAANVVDANNQFAFELYSKLSEEDSGNIFYSPYSISSAFAMTYEGAKGKTADEMVGVFHFPTKDILKPNFASIYNEINGGSDQYELRTGNALWLQQDYPFLEDYVKTVEEYYGGKAAGVDFVNEPEMSRETINSFIEEQTNEKIKDLIPGGSIDPMTRMVLTNAIYFKGTWEWEFDKSDTKDKNFKITPDNVVQVPMMFMDNDKAKLNYGDTEKLQILELPYKGDKLSMLILLPKQGDFYDWETGQRTTLDYTISDIELSSEKLVEYKSQMKEIKLDSVSIPKFEFDTKYMLAQTLAQMGMPTAFKSDGSADFSGMTLEESLFIDKVIHQAYVKVDEKGTEAAAATAIIMGATSAGPGNMFVADHPFIFIIQDKKTGNILFLGRVIDPR